MITERNNKKMKKARKKAKPCRFCGTTYLLLAHITAGGRGYFVECYNCHNCGKTRLTRRGAIKAWNAWNKGKEREIIIEKGGLTND